MNYAQHRAERIRLADGYEGWNMPPYPFLDEGRNRGRMFLVGFNWKGRKLIGLVIDPQLEAEMRAREKRQNRRFFT